MGESLGGILVSARSATGQAVIGTPPRGHEREAAPPRRESCRRGLHHVLVFHGPERLWQPHDVLGVGTLALHLGQNPEDRHPRGALQVVPWIRQQGVRVADPHADCRHPINRTGHADKGESGLVSDLGGRFMPRQKSGAVENVPSSALHAEIHLVADGLVARQPPRWPPAHALDPAEGRENRKRGDGKSDVLAEREVACNDRNTSGINDPELLLIGVHLRKTDMIDVMVMSGQTTYRTIDDQIADLLWQVATEIKTWAGARGAIVMLAADSLKGRLEATLQLYEYCTMLEVTEGSYTHIYSCSCIKQADGTWTGTDACAQHWDTKRGWKRARPEHGQLREGTVQDVARDVYTLSLGPTS